MQIENKDIAVVKQQVTKAFNRAEEITIKKDDDLVPAAEFLTKIKSLGKLIAAEEKKQLDPARATVMAIQSFFKPFKEKYAEAEQIVKNKVLEYDNKKRQAAAKKEAEIAAKVDEGKLSFEQGAKKIEKINTPPASIKTESGAKIQYRTDKKIVLTDMKALAKAVADGEVVADILTLNSVVARDLVIKNGMKIPGVKVEEVKTVVGNAL